MKFINKIKSLINKIIYWANKLEISLISASTSFYMIVAIFSLLILIIQFYNYFQIDNNLIINSIIDLLNPYYLEYLEDIIPIFSLNTFSPILLFNLIWSSSKFINGFNKASDIIYSQNKKRNYFINRISSIFIFIIILITLFIEVITILLANKIIDYIIHNIYIYMFVQFIIEFLLIFTTVLLINKYSPPVKIKHSNIYYGSFISSLLIYLLLIIFLLFIKIFSGININFSLLSIISLFFLLIYSINYCLVIGIYINYYLQKHPR